MKCENCIFLTTMEVKVSESIYSALSDAWVTISAKKSVPACGYSNGAPVEIPADRIACGDCKERDA